MLSPNLKSSTGQGLDYAATDPIGLSQACYCIARKTTNEQYSFNLILHLFHKLWYDHEVGTNQGGDSFHFLHQLRLPLRETGGRVSYYPVLLSWGHCLGSLLETAYSPLLSQTCICLVHNVTHAVWHNAMIEYSPFLSHQQHQ